jgi:hypothetical protein
MTPGNWIAIAGILVAAGLAVYGFIYRLDRRVSAIETRCENHQVIIDSIATFNSRLDKVAADSEVFWKVIGPHLANVIHSPKSRDRDALVEILTSDPKSLTGAELEHVIELLNIALAKNEWTWEKRFAGMLLLGRATALFNEATYERRRTA